MDKPKMPVDFSKITEKFDMKNLMGMVGSVKSMMGMDASVMPESAKDDPIAYRLAVITESIKALELSNAEQAKTIAKTGASLGDLYKELVNLKAIKTAAPEAAPKAPAEATPKAPTEAAPTKSEETK